MPSHDRLRALGLFDARAPRYTSYPPANHFGPAVGPRMTEGWLRQVRPDAEVSLYLHIPYCRRLCWFCACRTQGTSTDRPLVPYLDLLKSELARVGDLLPPGVTLGRVHLGGGTPTLLPPALLRELGAALAAFRPLARGAEFSVEIDPTEVDAPRIAALREIGMNRASIGVQDFDPVVQTAIGRLQGYDRTRDVVDMLRAAGILSLNIDLLYGLPHQTRARMSDSVQRVLSLSPDRIALYGYAHVPWMAKRQIMIPAEALPGAEARLDLFDTARRLFLWDGFREIGIDHFAREGDALAAADREGRLRRNFQGYTDDRSDTLIGIGASAISRFPQGYAQNDPASSRYAAAVQAGGLATLRGHAMTPEDSLRAAMIEELMCRFELDLATLSRRFGTTMSRLLEITAPLRNRFAEQIEVQDSRIRLIGPARLIARLAAQEIDGYRMTEGRHSRAL